MSYCLYLMRHAEAAPSTEHIRDFDRVLTPHGHAQANAAAHWLAAQAARPTYLLTSPAQRTAQTCLTVASILDVPQVVRMPALYDAELATCLHAVQTLPSNVTTALIVAHNPGMHELLSLLLGGPYGHAERFHMTTAACARLNADVPWSEWREEVPVMDDAFMP